MAENENMFIVRVKNEDEDWLYWSRPWVDLAPPDRDTVPWGFHSNPYDPELMILSLSDARKMVKELLAPLTMEGFHVQIRPWYCESNDPRIEDYESCKNYDWSLPYPYKTDFDPIPEVLIIVEGGLVAEIHTTSPHILVHVIDLDNTDIGLDPISRYELTQDTTSDGIGVAIASAFDDYLQGEGEEEDVSWNF